MAQFASGSFTGSDGTTLSTHDAAWSLHPSYSGLCQIAANRLRPSSTSTSAYYHSGTPASADYSVSSDLFAKDTDAGNSYTGVIGRVSTSANTFYMARYSGGAIDGWELFKFVAGTATQLGSTSSQSLTDETSHNIKLEMVGTAIKLYKEGSGSALLSSTDSAITSAGKAGIRSLNGVDPGDATGLHLDNFSADDISTATVITLTAATFDFVPNATQNTAALTLTAATFDFVPNATQNTAALSLTAAAFDFVAQDLTLTYSTGASADLTAAAFGFTANDAQLTVNNNLANAAFDFAANDAQIQNTLNLSAAAFDFVAQDLADHQMLLHFATGTFNFVAKSIRAGDPLAGSGRATNLMLMGVGN